MGQSAGHTRTVAGHDRHRFGDNMDDNTKQGQVDGEAQGGNVRQAVRYLGDSFCAGLPMRKALDATAARFQTAAWDTADAQARLMAHTLDREAGIQRSIAEFSFGAARASRFTRLLVDEIEHCGSTLSEEVATRTASLCQARSGERDMTRWVLLVLPEEAEEEGERNDITTLLRVQDAFSSVGMQVWDAGIWLSLAMSRLSLHGKRVLELGSGTGICAGSFKRCGVQHAWVTDRNDDEDILDNLNTNVLANCAGDCVSVRPLDVADGHDVRLHADRWMIDVIVAADMTYDDSLASDVITAVKCAVRGTRRVAWLVATRRNDDSFRRLSQLFGQARLRAQSVTSELRPPKPHWCERSDWQRVEAWRLEDAV